MLRVFVYAIIGISVLYIFTEIIKFLSAISGTRSQLIKDKEAFLSSFNRDSIISWTWDELSTLSMEVDFGTSKYNMITSAQEAVFLSIYNERIAHMMSKKYGERELMLIVTQDSTYELYKGNNEAVSLTIDQNEPIDIHFSENEFSFNFKNANIKLNKNEHRGEIFINDESIIRTNNRSETDAEVSRLVPLKPDNINLIYVPVVKFLLLFFLIWHQDNN